MQRLSLSFTSLDVCRCNERVKVKGWIDTHTHTRKEGKAGATKLNCYIDWWYFAAATATSLCFYWSCVIRFTFRSTHVHLTLLDLTYNKVRLPVQLCNNINNFLHRLEAGDWSLVFKSTQWIREHNWSISGREAQRQRDHWKTKVSRSFVFFRLSLSVLSDALVSLLLGCSFMK